MRFLLDKNVSFRVGIELAAQGHDAVHVDDLSMGEALVNLSHLTWRYGGLSDRVSMRVGLRLSAAGGALGLGYVC